MEIKARERYDRGTREIKKSFYHPGSKLLRLHLSISS